MNTVETDAVVAAATAGDHSAFAQLYAPYRPELVAHAYRILASHEDAEDLAQETFLRSWDKRDFLRAAPRSGPASTGSRRTHA
jgi:RNA polymerase sigma-70 factor, ECF subfamily